MILRAQVWNEHGDPQDIEAEQFESLREAVLAHLQTKEFGILTGSDGGAYAITLNYRAFDDEFRGRQVVCGVGLADLDKEYQRRKRECAKRVFSPAELYALKPIDTDFGSYHVVNVHLGDEVQCYDLDLDAVEAARRFETRTLADDCSDGRRTWTLQTVWFDGKPVMVVNSSGRDGDEYHDRWITDEGAFGELVGFLNSFTEGKLGEVVGASAKIPSMTEFYGGTIHDYYDVDAQGPKNK